MVRRFGVCLLILFSAVLFGQSSGIQGVVTDPSAAPIPDVKITVTNLETGVAIAAITK